MTAKFRSFSTLLIYLALISVMLGLTLALLYQSRYVSAIHCHTYATFQRLDRIPSSSVIYRAWAPRVAAIELSYRFVGIVNKAFRLAGSELPFDKHVQYAVALWTAGWFAAICVVYMVAFKKQSLFFMLGTYAGILFGYTPALDSRMYSWDMPALFFFVLATSILATMKMNLANTLILAAIIIIAIPFKETSVVLCMFPLFACTEQRMLSRLGLTAAIALLALGVKSVSNVYLSGSLFSFATNSFYSEESLFVWNIKTFVQEPIILANAGTLFAMLVVPVWTRNVLLFKTIAVCFIANNFLFGVINEYRIWFELIPLSLATLICAMCGTDDKDGCRTIGCCVRR